MSGHTELSREETSSLDRCALAHRTFLAMGLPCKHTAIVYDHTRLVLQDRVSMLSCTMQRSCKV